MNRSIIISSALHLALIFITAMSLPFLRWVHRFNRPDGVKYPLTMQNKVRNYFIGHLELGLSIEPIIEHFSEWKKRPQLEALAENVKLEMANMV